MSNRLEDLEVYQLAESFSDEIWFIVVGWDYFAKDTVGKQIVRFADSTSANIAEGIEDIIIKRTGTSVILAGVQLLKQKAG